MVETFQPMPVRSRNAPRPARRKPLTYVSIGYGTTIAEENGRAYKIEYLGSVSGNKNGYRTTAHRLRSRQIIATRDFGTVIDAKAWLDTLRLPGSA